MPVAVIDRDAGFEPSSRVPQELGSLVIRVDGKLGGNDGTGTYQGDSGPSFDDFLAIFHAFAKHYVLAVGLELRLDSVFLYSGKSVSERPVTIALILATMPTL